MAKKTSGNWTNAAKYIAENAVYDDDTETLFLTNPGISYDILKSLSKKRNFTIGTLANHEYVSIPTRMKYEDEISLYDDFMATYTYYNGNYETLLQAYQTFKLLDENQGEISLMLDTYVAEVLSQGFVDNPLEIKISNKTAETLVQKVLYKNRIYQRLPNITRELAKYGNFGLLLSYPYLEEWMKDDHVDFPRLDILEDLVISFVRAEDFKVNADEYARPVNYEVLMRNDPIKSVATSKQRYTIWQPWQFCFTGDTKISLLDGRELSLLDIQKEYGEGEFWVYSCREDGRIVPGRAHSLRKTRENAELVEVELDNGEKIHCTPDHKFMLRDGTYCEAKDLQPQTSLMPLYRQIVNSDRNRRGYEQHYDNAARKWLYTHYKVAQEVYGPKRDEKGRFTKSWHIHHKDFNSLNNSPENLQWLTCVEHNKLHNDIISDPILDANRRKASSEALKRTWRENYEYMCQQSSNNTKKVIEKRLAETGSKVTESQREASKRNIRLCLASGKKAKWTKEDRLKKSISSKEYYKKLKESMTEEQYRTLMKLRSKGVKIKDIDPKLINHKVVAVRPYHNEDVYDFTVDEYHNFALSAGVFVHNCHFLLPDMATEPYGKSMLWSMRSAFDQLTNLEALLALSRASKIQRLVFYVPMPNGINLVDSYEFMNDFRARYLNSIFTDSGNAKASRKIPGAMSILTLPMSHDGKKVEVDHIESNIDLSSVEDVDYFLDKVLRNSALPKGYLVGEDTITTAQTLEAQDLKLKRTLIPLKQGLLTGMMHLVENILTHAGYDVNKLDIEVSLNEPIQVPADIIQKYSDITELLGAFMNINNNMPNINKYQFLVKMGMPADLSALLVSTTPIPGIVSSEELGKFLINQKSKNPELPAPQQQEDKDNPVFGEAKKMTYTSKQFLIEHQEIASQLKEVREIITIKKDRLLQEKVLFGQKKALTEDVK